MKKVAIIQSDQFFTPALQELYLQNIPLLTSVDTKEIYNFIKKNATQKCILKYVLDINSGVLDKLIDYIILKKEKGARSSSIIDKCTFIATRSNATSVREKNILKGTNIYFTLTPVSEILKPYITQNDRMFAVSDTQTPYYNEIYNFKKNNNYRISELTVDILNKYKGSAITCALDTIDEYSKLVSVILQSNYRENVLFFEINYLDVVKPLVGVMFAIPIFIPGSGIVGNILDYPEFNIVKRYENTSLILVYQAAEWESIIKNELVSNKECNYSSVLFYLDSSDFN